MLNPLLPRLPIEDSIWGGPIRIDFPYVPIAPEETTPVPSPVLPSPPSPILPTPGIDIADSFDFDEAIIGIPNSRMEALELLGYVPTQTVQNSQFGGGGGFTAVDYWEPVILDCSIDEQGNLLCGF